MKSKTKRCTSLCNKVEAVKHYGQVKLVLFLYIIASMNFLYSYVVCYFKANIYSSSYYKLLQ